MPTTPKKALDNLTQELNALSMLAAFLGLSLNWLCESNLLVNANDHRLKARILEARSACNTVISEYDSRLCELINEREASSYESYEQLYL